MKFIAFAHLTFAMNEEEIRKLSQNAYFRKFLNITNPDEKRMAMTSISDTHNIRIIRNNFDFEVNTYSNGPGASVEISNSLIEDYDSSGEIRSSSFSSDFFCDLRNLLGIRTFNVDKTIRLRSLNPSKFISLKFDSNYPRFQEKVDIPGLASIAFYVTDIDSARFLNGNRGETETFKLNLDSIAYRIKFVRCGEVWVELIERI